MTTYSVRTLLLAVLLLGAIGASAAAEMYGEPWYETPTQTCSSCIDGIDPPYCGDMSPLAMLPCGKWYFQSSLIAIKRHATQNEVFQTRNVNTFTSDEVFDASGNSLGPPRVFNLVSTVTSQEVLGINDLDFQFSAGYEMLFGCKLADKYALEFSYFDLNDWSETGVAADATPYDTGATIDGNGVVTVTTTEPASLFSPFSDFGVSPSTDYDYNNLASITYRSSLDNVELNLRHWVTKRPSRLAVSVLFGARHNAVREQFGYSTENALGTNAVNVRAANDLWGIQVGSLLEFCCDPGWHLEFEVKGGVAQNRALQETTYSDVNGVNYWNRVDKDVTSWIGDMRLTLVYQFGSHVTTHLGYKALVLSDIATASRNLQPDHAILTGGPWVLNNGGSVVYHGPTAGLTVAW